MGSYSSDPPKPWVETPLIYSAPLSIVAGCNIFLKLENTQPSGSFKSRCVSTPFIFNSTLDINPHSGIGNMMSLALARSNNPDKVHFYWYAPYLPTP